MMWAAVVVLEPVLRSPEPTLCESWWCRVVVLWLWSESLMPLHWYIFHRFVLLKFLYYSVRILIFSRSGSRTAQNNVQGFIYRQKKNHRSIYLWWSVIWSTPLCSFQLTHFTELNFELYFCIQAKTLFSQTDSLDNNTLCVFCNRFWGLTLMFWTFLSVFLDC